MPSSTGVGQCFTAPRWNSPGRRVIYAVETYAGALLEILVHASGSVPQSQGYVEIEIPSGLSIEEITEDDLLWWDAPSF
jgi:RES domain-containing protein